MFRNVLPIALTSALIIIAISTARAEETDIQCEQGKCLASCAANAGNFATAFQVVADTTSQCDTICLCAAGDLIAKNELCACEADAKSAVTALAAVQTECQGCAHGQCGVSALTSNQTDGKCGADFSPATTVRVAHDASAHLAILHRRLVQEMTRNASLEAQLRFHTELAEAKEDFAKRMLKKETEVVKLHAELHLSNERNEMSQKVVRAMAENERLKASVELTHDKYELLKHVIAKKGEQQAEDLASSLTKSKDHNTKLMDRIVELEKQLETLRLRLAGKPVDRFVK